MISNRHSMAAESRRHKYMPELNAITSTAIVAALGAVLLIFPHTMAFADVPQSVTAVIGLVGNAVKVVGVGLALWGIVKIGTSLSNGSGGSGNELSEGIGRIAGGVLIFAAASFFSNILSESGF